MGLYHILKLCKHNFIFKKSINCNFNSTLQILRQIICVKLNNVKQFDQFYRLFNKNRLTDIQVFSGEALTPVNNYITSI